MDAIIVTKFGLDSSVISPKGFRFLVGSERGLWNRSVGRRGPWIRISSCFVFTRKKAGLIFLHFHRVAPSSSFGVVIICIIVSYYNYHHYYNALLMLLFPSQARVLTSPLPPLSHSCIKVHTYINDFRFP